MVQSRVNKKGSRDIYFSSQELENFQAFIHFS